jgi:hypothetical protein
MPTFIRRGFKGPIRGGTVLLVAVALAAFAGWQTAPVVVAAPPLTHVPAGQTLRCAADEALGHHLSNNPASRIRHEKMTTAVRKWLAEAPARLPLGRFGVVTIPVVVHVVHRNDAEDIPDAQIHRQIEILNEDYRRLNADAAMTPGAFAPVAADVQIQFQLAARDPSCMPTTGITRTRTTRTSFTMELDDVKFDATGGKSAWPRDKYLNMWVAADVQSSTLGPLYGYGFPPSVLPEVDGVVIATRAFGETATPVVDKGRTATHEVGHWLAVGHVFGPNRTCSPDDGVSDTPIQAAPHGGCPAFPSASCGNEPNGDMFMNYMDYSDDTCMNLFTIGQGDVMTATLFTARTAILGSDALVPPVPAADLWSQDTHEDQGEEPNVHSRDFWVSGDIWVRRERDGFTNQEHENPEYRAPGGRPNYVYVRVRNRGCGMSAAGDVRLYWAKASTALGWPAPWDGSVAAPALMGGSIGAQPTGMVAAGDSTIVEFEWRPPNPADYAAFGLDRAHFCLLSRLETAGGMTFPEGSDLGANVRNNNNIVWKNVTVGDTGADGRSRQSQFAVVNMQGSESQTAFTFQLPPELNALPTLRPLLRQQGGLVQVRLSARLHQLWLAGGRVASGVRLEPDGLLTLLNDWAFISGIKLAARETQVMEIHVRKPHAATAPRRLTLDVEQYSDVAGAFRLQGGERVVSALK